MTAQGKAKPKKGKRAGDGADGRAKADARALEQQRVINRHRRQLTRLGGILTKALEVQTDPSTGQEIVRTAQDCAALVRTAEQLHRMERVAQGIDSDKAQAPGVILVPASALSMESWQAGAPADGEPDQVADQEARPVEDDIQGDADGWEGGH